MIPQPAVFLDRDGVINREMNYVHRIEDFHFIEGVFDACLEMQRAGYRLVVITNQAGIARGYYSEDDYRVLTGWMLEEFHQRAIAIADVYYCPHHPVYGLGEYRRACDCRKPAPGMIARAAREHDLDLARSVLVGDKLSDIEAGRAAGVGCCVLVRTGHPVSDTDAGQADCIFPDLAAFADALGERVGYTARCC
jgi:D-glycero-D-manno-heptose 1,7-bisphosphate phosphatase